MAATSVPLMADVEGEDMAGSGIKNDFAYHNNVVGASKNVRLGFLRKVYGLLSVQLLMTTVVATALFFTPQIKNFVQENPSTLLLAFIANIGLLFGLIIKRRESPANLIYLAAFTVTKAFTVGIIVSFYDASMVLQAFFLTAAVVVGLTTFTFQTKRDFSHWGAGLISGLWILILAGFMQIFVGGEVTDMAIAVGGAFLFSGFIIFDTQMIMTRMSPEEYILATIELYLDILNLFLEILRILDKVNRR